MVVGLRYKPEGRRFYTDGVKRPACKSENRHLRADYLGNLRSST
jgi:hypothetical protein